MAETQAAKSAAGAGSFDMPTSLGGASGAMTLSAKDDADRTEKKVTEKKKKKCCWARNLPRNHLIRKREKINNYKSTVKVIWIISNHI